MFLELTGWVKLIHVSTCWYSSYQNLYIKKLALYRDNTLYCHISAAWAINWAAKRYFPFCYFRFMYEYFEQVAACCINLSFHVFPQTAKNTHFGDIYMFQTSLSTAYLHKLNQTTRKTATEGKKTLKISKKYVLILMSIKNKFNSCSYNYTAFSSIMVSIQYFSYFINSDNIRAALLDSEWLENMAIPKSAANIHHCTHLRKEVSHDVKNFPCFVYDHVEVYLQSVSIIREYY